MKKRPLLHLHSFVRFGKMLALVLLPFAQRVSAIEITANPTPSGAGWMSLHGGGSVEFWDEKVQNFPSWFNGGFVAYGPENAQIESNHQLAVIYNGVGWDLFLKFDCADPSAARGGTTEIFVCTDDSADHAATAPRHIVIHPAEKDAVHMVPEYSGAAVPVEARKRPDHSKPYMTEDRPSCGYAPTGAVNHEFKIAESGTRSGTWYVSSLFRWPYFGLELPFYHTEVRNPRWRLKVIRRAADGGVFVWGANDKPYTGYGLIKWPQSTASMRADIYRQWIISGAKGPAEEQTDTAREYWRVSPLEAGYGFRTVPEPTFQPREAKSDTEFLQKALTPYTESNAKMLDALSYSPEKGAKAIGWPQEEKDRFFMTQIERLFTVKDEIDELRRRYLIDKLLGREIKAPEKKNKGKTESRGIGDPDALDLTPDGGTLDLDEELLF